MASRLLNDAIEQETEAVERIGRASRAQVASLKKLIERQSEEIDRLNREVDLKALLEGVNVDHGPLHVSKSRTNAAIPIFIWSDWHVEERIEKSKVLGRNEMNLEVAERRAEKCATSTVKMIRHVRESSRVDSVFLFLGGDFITGDIHEELCETNLLGPAEATCFAYELICKGLETIAAEKYLKTIRVACAVGNHGRTTKKMRFKNGKEKSFESIIYAMLAKRFGSKRFQWEITSGGVGMSYLAPHFAIRTCHGHQVRYQGGVGGLTIPLAKWIYRQDQTLPAGWNLIGHHHQYGMPTNRCLSNGSLIGWSEYATENGFPFEPAQQAGCIYDVTRNRVTGVFPIFCD
jgi:hypothetical protein